MKRVSQPLFVSILLFLAIPFTGCGRRPVKTGPTLSELVQSGQCATVMSKTSDADPSSADEIGARALCQIIMGRPADAIDTLRQNGTTPVMATHNAIALTVLLENTGDYLAAEVPFTAIVTALGAAGYGPMAGGGQRVESGSEAANRLGMVVMAALGNALSTTAKKSQVPLMEIWNGWFSLMGGNLAIDDDYAAWTIFTGLAQTALYEWDGQQVTDLARVLMDSTIKVIQGNPKIAVAAKCDLATPYEQLKSVLAKNVDLLGPLERAVSQAMGCRRGRFAPAPEKKEP